MLTQSLFAKLSFPYEVFFENSTYRIKRTFSSYSELCLTTFLDNSFHEILSKHKNEITVILTYKEDDLSFISVTYLHKEKTLFSSNDNSYAKLFHYQLTIDTITPYYTIDCDPIFLFEESRSVSFPDKILTHEKIHYHHCVSSFLPLCVAEFAENLNGLTVVEYVINQYSLSIYISFGSNPSYSVGYSKSNQNAFLHYHDNIPSLEEAFTYLKTLLRRIRMESLFS